MQLKFRLQAKIIMAVVLALCCVGAMDAKIQVNGVVADSLTRQPVGGALICFQGDSRHGVTGSDDGRFVIASSKQRKGIEIKVMGYRPVSVSLNVMSGRVNLDTLFLVPQSKELAAVVVKPKKQKYSKKNNPAVRFMQRLRASGDSIDPVRAPYFSTNEYEKIVLGMNVKDEAVGDSTLRQYVDYSVVTGKPYITISLKEQRSRVLHKNGDRNGKRVVEGYRSVGIDQSFDVGNMRKIYQDILRPVDLYSNDITLLQNRFVSPLSRIGPDFYKYYLTDTVLINGEPNIELTFTPHNRESMGFTGRIYVPMTDSTMMPRKVVMQIPRDINLNYVKSLYIVQNFERDSLGNRIKTSDDLTVEFRLVAGTPEVYARRETRVDGYSYASVEEFSEYYDAEGDEFFIAEAYNRDDAYWTGQRVTSMSGAQEGMGNFMTLLRRKKWFYWGEKFVALMDRGYLRTGKRSVFDIGPLNTMISFNDIEGARVRFGGMTTANLSKRLFARAYGAYGFKDHKWKYGGELEYSFVDKNYHSREFPIHSLRFSFSYDMDQIGQHYLFTNQDNVFLSLKRTDNYLMTYRRYFNLLYTLERRSGFSLETGLRWERQEPTKWVPFVAADGWRWNHYNASAFTLQLRYAPGETFYQSATMRRPINMDAPIILLTQEFGPKGMLGADYTINKTELSMQKRFWFSAFGYADVIVKGAKLWSKVFYPALPWANANLSYTIQPESFALLNPMEFAVDQSVSWDLTYWMNGLIFNRIPYINKAKLREVISFRGFYGSLTDKNNPYKQTDIPTFPADSHTALMGHKPYMEIGVGLDNVLTFLRIDYVWRLTYRDLPGVDKSGLRVSLHFSF